MTLSEELRKKSFTDIVNKFENIVEDIDCIDIPCSVLTLGSSHHGSVR